MTKSTYAEACLERAEKATEGPWHRVAANVEKSKHGHITTTWTFPDNAEFIAHARTDVPELARRLDSACDAIRKAADALNGYGTVILSMDPFSKILFDLADELEAMPEGENKLLK